MKTKLIVDLIEGHFTSNQKFDKAVSLLILDEENKGNIGVASELKNAYLSSKKKKNFGLNLCEPKTNSLDLMSLSAPIDDNTKLELFEIIEPNSRLEDVVLSQSIKNKLAQIIKERQNAKVFKKKNLVVTNRVLLYGPPGCGKTLAAQALANELGLPMAYVRIDGLVSSLLGETSSNLRKVFKSINNFNIVLFLDEFDAIAKKRDDAQELGELKRVVTSLLQNFDSLSQSVFLIAATNHPQLLDPAIWRRFDTILFIDLPDFEQRCEILRLYLEKYDIKNELDILSIAKITDGLSCANLEQIVIDLGKKQILENKSFINQNDFILSYTNFLSNYSNNFNMWKAIKEINDKGVSLRDISKAIGVPHTTIQYKLGGIK